jgi:uncharacterized protein (TIGR03790 family)
LYNAALPESLAVAEHYVQVRGIPSESLCPLTPAAPDAVSVADYSKGVAEPVLACIGGDWDRWLFLVPVWGVPYRVDGAARDIANASNIVPASLDALLSEVWRYDDLPLSLTWNPYAREAASADGIYEPPLAIADWRESTGDTFFLVSRLDGASPEDAMRLVDDAVAAEAAAAAGTLSGLACVDRGWQPLADDEFGSYASVEWDLLRLNEIFIEAGLATLYDELPEEIGTPPAPERCDDALFYGGWYSYNVYHDVFTWNPGSVGFHFDSCSACDPRGGPNWSANALQRGIAATMGAVWEPYVAGLMGYDQFFLYFLNGHSFAESAWMATPITHWMAIYLGDPLYSPYRGMPLLPAGWTPGNP